MNKKLLGIIMLIIVIGLGLGYFKFYGDFKKDPVYKEQKEIMKQAKANVLENIAILRELIDTKQLEVELNSPIPDLGYSKDKRAVPILCEVLLNYTEPVTPEEYRYEWSMDGADHARMEAAQALLYIRDLSSTSALKQAALNDKIPEVRKSALFSLKSIAQQDSLETLKRALNDPDEKVRFTAKELIDSLK
ncbi:HEAT repeat domain-containing protein [bacterium]